jgi:hypothetical protein
LQDAQIAKTNAFAIEADYLYTQETHWLLDTTLTSARINPFYSRIIILTIWQTTAN